MQVSDRSNIFGYLSRTLLSISGKCCLSGGNRHRHTSHMSTPKLYTSILAVCLLRCSVITSGAAYTTAPSAGVVARWQRLAEPKSDSLAFQWMSGLVYSRRTLAHCKKRSVTEHPKGAIFYCFHGNPYCYHGNSKILLPWGVQLHRVFYSALLTSLWMMGL